MREAAETRSYAAALSVLTWPLSLDWATRAPKPLPNNFVHCQVVHRGSLGGLA
jgi:thiaminase/transcriptional activator TenA